MAIVKNQKTSASRGVNKLALLCIAGRNVKWHNHYGKPAQRCLKKLNIEFQYDPAIPLPGIYTKEVKTGTQMDI